MNIINLEKIIFKGRLEGMPTTFTQYSAGYTPSVYYKQRLMLGVPARTQDTIYEALCLYKRGAFVAKTTTGYASEYKKDGYHIITVLTSKKGMYDVKAVMIDSDDLIKPLSQTDAKLGVVLALIPEILNCPEAKATYDTMSDFLEWDVDAEDWMYNSHISEFAMLLNRFSTNMEVRYLHHSEVPENIRIPEVNFGRSLRLREEDLTMKLEQIFMGQPTYIKGKADQKSALAPSSFGDFAGSFSYNKERIFSEEEQNLMAKIPEKYVMPEFVPEICNFFKESSVFPAPMRVAYLIGPAGTGKTEAANAIFAGLGLPGGHYTCNPATEIFDFIGQVFPNTASEKISFEEVRKELNLPSTEDIVNDPAESYRLIYGKAPVGFPDEGQLILEMIDRIMKYMSENVSGKNFTYVESGLIKAARMGWGFEIQEIGCVLRPGVAVGLNALLETGGNAFITLPTGEVIKKHPDCTFVFTSNDEYEGCVNLNQSVLDRMSLVYRIENPPQNVMAERIKARLNFPDAKILDRMIEVIYALNDAAKNKGITDGVCGYRSLENWCMAAMIKAKAVGTITEDICYQTGIQTVMNKVSQKADYVEELMPCLTCQFASPYNI